jgi:hypothetical protein
MNIVERTFLRANSEVSSGGGEAEGSNAPFPATISRPLFSLPIARKPHRSFATLPLVVSDARDCVTSNSVPTDRLLSERRVSRGDGARRYWLDSAESRQTILWSCCALSRSTEECPAEFDVMEIASGVEPLVSRRMVVEMRRREEQKGAAGSRDGEKAEMAVVCREQRVPVGGNPIYGRSHQSLYLFGFSHSGTFRAARAFSPSYSVSILSAASLCSDRIRRLRAVDGGRGTDRRWTGESGGGALVGRWMNKNGGA